ncbi:MAG: DUF3108 domain-containing protein [Bacteroidales bacterium]|nr:DUF3108 domain-containing protein [Bacteroidales bacterium]
MSDRFYSGLLSAIFRFSASALLCALTVIPGISQTRAKTCIPTNELTPAHLAYAPGEKLTYSIHYKWGPINADVANATFDLTQTTLNGQEVYHVKLFGKNSKVYDPFFKMREDFRTWFSPEGIVPVRFTRDTKEGNWFSTNDYNFKWNTSSPHIEASLDSKRKGPRVEELPLTDCTFDVLSLFYYARNLDFDAVKKDVKYPVTFAVDDDICNIYFIWKGRETINVKGIGKVKTMKFVVKLVAGDVFGDDENADGTMWFTDDDNRLLVYFETPIRIGAISGRLASYEGIRYPFSAKVQ